MVSFVTFLPRAHGDEPAFRILLLFGLLGTCYLGLALVGLYYAALIWAFVPVAAILIRPAIPYVKAPPVWVYFGFLPLVVVGLVMLAPDTNVDTFQHYLATPELFLREHRFTHDFLRWVTKTPILAELVNGLWLTIGAHAMPHFVQAVCFGAGLWALCIWVADRSSVATGWLLAVLLSTCAMVESEAMLAKNDLIAAGFLMAAAARTFGNRPMTGAVLFGFAAAVKMNALLCGAVAFGVLAITRPRIVSLWFRLAALPVLPWLIKFVLVWVRPELECLNAVELSRTPWDMKSTALAIPAHWLQWWWNNHPAALACFAVGAVGMWKSRPGRMMFWFSLAAFVAMCLLLPMGARRYALPAMLLMAASLVVGIKRPSIVLIALLAVGVWVPLKNGLLKYRNPFAEAYLRGALRGEKYYERKLTTYWTLRNSMSSQSGIRRTVMVGDFRTFQLPGRFAVDTWPGRTWPWALARESTTAERIAVRLRQMGCRHLAHNFVGEISPHRQAAAYEWDSHMLKVWFDFVGRYMDVVWSTGQHGSDPKNGGFTLYAVRKEPLAAVPAMIPHLPGIESVFFRVTAPARKGDFEETLARAKRLSEDFPQVSQFRSFVAEVISVKRKYDSRK